MKFGAAWPVANFELIEKTTEIAPGMTLLALISDAPGTKELKELSLALNTPQGWSSLSDVPILALTRLLRQPRQLTQRFT
jgi:hypothetical protein